MITTYLIIQAALFSISVWGFVQSQKFLKLSPSISRASDLENFKRLVRHNMYGALVYICLSIPALLLSMFLTFSYGVIGFGIVVGVSIPQFLFGRYSKTFEVKSRNVPCAVEYAAEHQRIGHSWGKKALPDF